MCVLRLCLQVVNASDGSLVSALNLQNGINWASPANPLGRILYQTLSPELGAVCEIIIISYSYTK